jgi:hypothetical protein
LGALTLVALLAGAAAAADWPGFRGPNGNGSTDERGLPVTWDTKSMENVAWKSKLPGLGTSSPVVVGDNVLVTCYTGYGQTEGKGFGGFGGFGKGGFGKGKGGFGKGKGGFGKGGAGGGGDQKKLRLVVLCFDRDKGDVRWQKEVEPKLPEAGYSGFISEHGYASSTPVTDGERVYVFFGKTGVFCFDLKGKQLWQASVGTGTDKWGSAASPVLHKNLVIVNAAIESDSVVALDKLTGKEVWRAKGMATNWVTPALVDVKGGKTELVLSVPGKLLGLDPESGKELWRCTFPGGAGNYTTSSPAVRGDVVYAMNASPGVTSMFAAVKAGGRGDVTKTHILWQKSGGAANTSPVVVGDYVCWVSGRLTCMKADTGETAHKETLYAARSEYVSPVAADGKIYVQTRSSGLYVVSAGEKFEKLAHNEFAGDSSIFNATPAISGGRLFVRSNQYLYCIGKK